MLDSVELSNFRGFADLKLEGLGRVNLVVGKNNTGKTSLLEGLTLLCDSDRTSSLPGMYRANVDAARDRFHLGLLRDGAKSQYGWIRGKGADLQWGFHFHSPETVDAEAPSLNAGDRPRLWSGQHLEIMHFGFGGTARATIIPIEHRRPEDLVGAFSTATSLAQGEAQMEALLRAVEPRIKTIRLAYVPNQPPYIVVDVGLSERIPLSQAGQGIYRLVSIFSELLGQKPQVAFIDEIENGIHHTALPQVWKGIAEVAEQLDIQVFATTHSGECLAAAHEVFGERSDYGLRVIQLYRVADRVEGRVLDQKHIAAALAGEIELR